MSRPRKGTKCTRCRKRPRRAPDQRWCNSCSAEYKRYWRKLQRVKSARAIVEAAQAAHDAGLTVNRATRGTNQQERDEPGYREARAA